MSDKRNASRVRGRFRNAQTRGKAPSPDPPSLKLRRVDLSPQAGRGEGPARLRPAPQALHCPNDLRRRRRRPLTQNRPDQAAWRGSLRRHAGGRPARRPLPRHADRRGRARCHHRAHRPAGVRIRHGPRRPAGDPDVPRLQEIHLHLAQPRGLPRHPRRQADARRRHRQYRRDPDPRRLARRLRAACSRSARSRAGPSG